MRFETHIKVDAPGMTAIDLLAGRCALARTQLKTAMSNGAVWLESRQGIQRIRRAKKRLHQGDSLHLYYDSEIQSRTPAAAALIADEGDYSVWNKPYGMYSQGSKWGDHCTIYRWAEQHLQPQRPAYLVHRLDRAANGLIMLAHNKKTATAFVEMFRQHTVTKRYRAIVEGDLSRLELPYTIDTELDNKPAESVILETESDPERQATTVIIDIRTGRKHQIRRHLSSLGHPVVGDRLYGARNTEKDLQLSSVFLGFTSPIDNKPRSYSLTDDPAGQQAGQR